MKKYFIQDNVSICPICGAHLNKLDNGIDLMYKCHDVPEHLFIVCGEGISERELGCVLYEDDSKGV